MSKRRGGRNRGATEAAAQTSPRSHRYRQLRHPFEPQRVFSDDAISAIHNKALLVLEELGIKMLLPQARTIFAGAGSLVDESCQMVRIGADLVQQALKTAPPSTRIRAI